MSTRRKPAGRSTGGLYGVILAGGRGTRFWPRSRRNNPKQLMKLWGESSLLRQTVERLQPMIPSRDIWVFTNRNLVREVSRQLPEVPRSQIIAEPVQRNTGPCIGLAAELIAARDPEAVLGVFPSDHLIRKPAAFHRVLRLAAKQARLGKIVVLGVSPRWPETGYGYLEFARRPALTPLRALPVERFREKPGLAVARRYCNAKRFFWNSGIFFWKASVIQEALQRHLPGTAATLTAIRNRLSGPRGIQLRRLPRVLAELFPACENISVDYAVLEKASQVVGIPCDFGWNDLGTWSAVYDLLAHDSRQNALCSETLLLNSRGLLVDVPGKLVAAVGLQDLVVVETEDALLIVRRDQTQQISQVVSQLEKARREDLL